MPRLRAKGARRQVRVCAIARVERLSCAAVETLFSVLQVAISVVLVLLVLMHSGKDSGLSGAFGVGSGTGPLGGGSMVERNLNRWTVFFAILFLVNAVILLKRPWA
jgi:preprotein translocase subunit SecG